jgi:hypothetical protein
MTVQVTVQMTTLTFPGVPLGVLFFLFAYALLWVDAAQAEVVRLGTQGILSFFPFTIRASEWSQ